MEGLPPSPCCPSLPCKHKQSINVCHVAPLVPFAPTPHPPASIQTRSHTRHLPPPPKPHPSSLQDARTHSLPAPSPAAPAPVGSKMLDMISRRLATLGDERAARWLASMAPQTVASVLEELGGEEPERAVGVGGGVCVCGGGGVVGGRTSTCGHVSEGSGVATHEHGAASCHAGFPPHARVPTPCACPLVGEPARAAGWPGGW
jgi:hypothetical protein